MTTTSDRFEQMDLFFLALECDEAVIAKLHTGAHRNARRLRDQNPRATFGGAFNAACGVNGIANHRVVLPMLRRTDESNNRFAAVEADADVKIFPRVAELL